MYKSIHRINMTDISKPDKNFNFDRLSLTSPIAVTGGNHFIRIIDNDGPLYIQSPKCISKDGVVISGKKTFCDLLFENKEMEFVQWMVDFGEYIQNELFINRAKWFESEMDIHDIENFMVPPLKIHKTKEFYILRTTVPTRLGVCTLNIFNEFEGIVKIDDINGSTNMITILEVKGIKCSPRSFQIDIEIKQMLVLSPNNIFDKCIIHPNVRDNVTDVSIMNKDDTSIEPELKLMQFNNNDITDSIITDKPLDESDDCIEEVSDIEILNNFVDNVNCDITEVELNLDTSDDSEVVHITNRNDVYYKMYRDAMQKAKTVRNLALSAYMKAKQIKNEYMLDDIKDEYESDLDDESFNFELQSNTNDNLASLKMPTI